MTAAKRDTALIAAAPSPGTDSGRDMTSQTSSPVVLTWERMRLSVWRPIPRRGELMTRVNEIASAGLARSER